MIGFGDTHLIDGHHLDMIDGAITVGATVGITMGGTITVGIITVGMGTIIGTIGTTLLIIIEEVM